ncbi:MAG: dUTP diphosphatase [Oligoflexia bacterium]|nr:dUTP diphosphatase [Oligoflexia bacterium]
MEIRVKLLSFYDESIPLPAYQTLGAAGADIRAQLLHLGIQQMEITPGSRVLIPTGVCMEIPPGFEVQIRPRSGLSLRTGLMILNSPGTIDCDYRGEVQIIMGNLGSNTEIIRHGERIAQIVLAPVGRASFIVCSELHNSLRGADGFGHSGSL